LLVLGALLLRSVWVEREQLQSHILQVQQDLVDEVDRDIDRHLTILRTLATSSFLETENWPAFYNQSKAALQGRAYIILVDVAGRQLVNTYVPFGQQPELTGDFETIKRIVESKQPFVSNLFTSKVVLKP